MAYHGYLHLEGGNLMIEFILKQCALPEEPEHSKDKRPEVDNEQLRSLAESVLTLFSTTVENMHQVLWPQLFEYLTHSDYSRALNALCKCLAHIGEQKRSTDAPDYRINFKELINLPKTHEIFSRLFILAGVPLSMKNRGLNVLQLMKNISPLINPSIVELWDSLLPKLYLNLEDQISNGKFDCKKWEGLLIKCLSKTLELVKDENEICEFGNAFAKHVSTLFQNHSEEKV